MTTGATPAGPTGGASRYEGGFSRADDAGFAAVFDGKGAVEIGPISIVLVGRKRRPFGFGSSARHEVALADVVNVRRDGTRVRFAVTVSGQRQTVAFTARSEEEAARLAAALPATESADVVVVRQEQTDFAVRLVQTTPHAVVTPLIVAVKRIADIKPVLGPACPGVRRAGIRLPQLSPMIRGTAFLGASVGRPRRSPRRGRGTAANTSPLWSSPVAWPASSMRSSGMNAIFEPQRLRHPIAAATLAA